MNGWLKRRPVRNAYDLANLSRRLLRLEFKADLTGVRICVTWDAARRTNVVTAEADRGDP